MTITNFWYDPEFKTIVKYRDGKEIDRLSVEEGDLESLSIYLSTYLFSKKFTILVLDSEQKVV